MAGYEYEGAHTLCWLVHPIRSVLASRVAGGGASPDGLAGISPASLNRNHCECFVCIDSRGVVFTGAGVGRKKDLDMERRKKGNGLETFLEHWGLPLVGAVIGTIGFVMTNILLHFFN